MQDSEKQEKREIFTRIVKAGKRTYFIDVKKIRSNNQLFLTITESKKRIIGEGRVKFEKHKLYLYQEDFNNFIDALGEAMDFITDSDSREIEPEVDNKSFNTEQEQEDILFEDSDDTVANELTEVEFEDLGK